MGRQASQLADGCSFPITIHANPKAAGVRKGFDDPYRRIGSKGPSISGVGQSCCFGVGQKKGTGVMHGAKYDDIRQGPKTARKRNSEAIDAAALKRQWRKHQPLC
jgi:hypothetical protein